MKKFGILTAAVAAVGLMVLAFPALAQSTVTSFELFAPFPTPGVWFQSGVQDGGTASIADLTGAGGDLETNQPAPIGAAKLTTRLNENNDKAEVGVAHRYGMPQDIFSTLSIMYSYHKATNAGQNPAAAPSLKLTFFNSLCDDAASLGRCFATLVYEPTWNGPGSTSASPASTNPATDAWTAVTIDENTGLFWTTGGFGFGNSFGGPPIKTLAEWRTALSSDFGDAALFRVSVGVGSSNQGQIGYFDEVDISHAFSGGFSESYDFDPAPSFETLGECISTLIADECSSLSGRDRANCNHEQQMTCFDLFDIK